MVIKKTVMVIELRLRFTGRVWIKIKLMVWLGLGSSTGGRCPDGEGQMSDIRQPTGGRAITNSNNGTR